MRGLASNNSRRRLNIRGGRGATYGIRVIAGPHQSFQGAQKHHVYVRLSITPEGESRAREAREQVNVAERNDEEPAGVGKRPPSHRRQAHRHRRVATDGVQSGQVGDGYNSHKRSLA